ALDVRDADDDLAVKAAGAAQRRVDRVHAVRGGDDHDLAARVEPVHESEELRDDAALELALDVLARGGDRVELLDEDDRGRALLRLLELVAKLGLRLAVELRHDLRALDREKGGPALVRDRLGDEGLAGPGRAVEEDALGGLDAEPVEELGVLEG